MNIARFVPRENMHQEQNRTALLARSETAQHAITFLSRVIQKIRVKTLLSAWHANHHTIWMTKDNVFSSVEIFTLKTRQQADVKNVLMTSSNFVRPARVKL